MAVETSIRLIDLPYDVLRLIFRHNVSVQDLKSLRYVHFGLHSIVDPLLFEKIKISAPIYLDEVPYYDPSRKKRRIWSPVNLSFPNAGDPDPETSEYQISAILERRVPPVLIENAQNIVVRRYDIYEGYPDEEKMKKTFPQYSQNGIESLGHFLCSMKKLQALSWSIPYSGVSREINLSPIAGQMKSLCLVASDPGGPPNCPHEIFRGFAFLRSLEINLTDTADYCIAKLDHLPHLKKLVLTAYEPRIRLHRKIDIVDFLKAQRTPFSLQTLLLSQICSTIPIPQDIAKTFLSELQTLHLYTGPGLDSCPVVNALGENSINIRHLTLEGCHPDITDYLKSYQDTLISFEVSVNSASDNKGFDDEEDPWAYSGSRSRRQEEILEQKIQTFKSDVWKSIVAAHKNSIEVLSLAENFHLEYDDAQVLSQCKALKIITMKGDDDVFEALVPVAAKLPLLQTVNFELPWRLRKPNMSGWCGTAQVEWYRKPNDFESRIRSLHWREEDIDIEGSTWANVCFRLERSRVELRLMRRQDKYYPWILVGEGDLGIEGREGDNGTDEDEDEGGDEGGDEDGNEYESESED
ncbi:hypothetical protein TWF730_003976 [Orbilia blumenaviensis]|uniref:F-box domain-containing protein n=1 Tax=Orbilia blumenaviensis TaxID=1796055 RepID=A0AAV9U558_9PEZI